MIKIRTCIACRNKKQKSELLRIVSENGKAVLDETQKINSRGIYLCNDSKCITKLLKAKDITKCVKIDASKESIIEILRNLGE